MMNALLKILKKPFGKDGTRSRLIQKDDIPGIQQICKVCERAVDQIRTVLGPSTYLNSSTFDPPPNSILQHHLTLDILRSSAKSGCHLCSILGQSLYEGQDDPASLSYVLRWAVPPDTYLANLVVELANGFSQATSSSFNTSEGGKEFGNAKFFQTLQCLRTDDPKVLDLAREWLHTCLAKHRHCRRATTFDSPEGNSLQSGSLPSFFPSRLIEIASDGNLVTSARLVYGTTVKSNDAYLTLSHCWGGSDIIKLSICTLEAFQTSIPLSRLPKTFADALFLTVRLGFRYIWIDSLCIIQDSTEDWQLESEQMGRIYWHSECTIAAVKAHNSHEGLFSERYPLSFLPYKLPVFERNGHAISMYTSTGRATQDPLYTRAWAVQERCLAQRTLHFAADVVSWECLTMKASERGTVGYSEDSYAPRSSLRGSTLKETRDYLLNGRKYLETIGIEESDQWLSRWWIIVKHYSSCNLTFATDRYEAIRGLASLVQYSRKVSMVEGLWHQFLGRELLWRATQPCKERYLPTSLSWSWTNISGEVSQTDQNNFEASDIEATVEIIDCSGAVSSQPLTTVIKQTPLRFKVTARLLRIIWKPPMNLGAAKYRGCPFEFSGGGTIPTDLQLSDWLWYWQPDILPESSWNLWALQIVPNAKDRFYSERGSRGIGLIILPVNGKEDLFQRVGYYRIRWYTEVDTPDLKGTGDRLSSNLFGRGGIHREFGDMRTIQLI